jgi:NADPH:quinone reductase
MKAIQVSSFGAPEVLRVTELPDSAPGLGEVAVDVTCAAVGLIDVFIRQGLYRDRPGLPQPPYVPGLEVAGTARALGEGVAGFEAGEPAVTLSANSGTGGYAAIFVSDAAYVASMKDVSLDPALAVAVVPNGATAYLTLTQIARIRVGERVLVHGALGGLAAGFPGIARQLGASRVVGTVRASGLEAAQQTRLSYDGSSIPLSCLPAWRASASISSSTPSAVPSYEHPATPGRNPPGCARYHPCIKRSARPDRVSARADRRAD